MKVRDDIYVYEWANYFDNNCNSYYIGGNVQALIDPGLTRYLPDLLNQMANDGIKKKDIQYVINTHSHPDHFQGSELFTTGLFSLIDAILDQTMGHVMKTLPLSESIKAALVRGEGELSGFVNLVRNYEAGNWQAVSAAALDLGPLQQAVDHLFFVDLEAENHFQGPVGDRIKAPDQGGVVGGDEAQGGKALGFHLFCQK